MKRYVLIAICAMITPTYAGQTFNQTWLDRYAGPTFDQMWSERIIAMIRQAPMTTAQVEEEANPSPVPEQNVEETRHHRPKDPDCMTYKEARKKYPLRYISWKGNHCWFAPHHRR